MDPTLTLDEKLIALAGVVADGRSPDWSSADSSASTDEERQLVGNLRAIAAICRVDSTAAGNSGHPASWGPLRILGLAGRGSYGDVYRAWDPGLDREVALKLLREPAARTEPGATLHQDVIEEGRLMARVRHPNVVTIFGAQRIDGRTGLWMEFVEGRTLEAELHKTGLFDAPALASVGVELCGALAAVHRAGLVHRDVKSTNVMRDVRGRVVLGDFGTGLEADEPDAERIGLVGTPAFLAPEIFARAPASPQSDVYSLGALLFRLATGDYPVSGRSIRELRDAHAAGRRTRLREVRPDLPRDLSSAIDRALDPDPTRRFGNADAMARALLRSTKTVSRRLAIAAGVFVALAGLLYAGAVWRESRPAVVGMLRFQPRDWVLVTTFENRTGQPIFDETVEVALKQELSLSAFVNVVPDDRITDALRLSGRRLPRPLDRPAAREVAVRDGGIQVLIMGRIDKRRSGYAITVEIVQVLNVAADRTAVTLLERAPAESDVVAAVRRQALRIRRALGESADSIQATASSGHQPPLVAIWNYARALVVMRQAMFRVDAARDALHAALAAQPDYPPALAMQAWLLLSRKLASTEYLPLAERAAAAAAGEPAPLTHLLRALSHELRAAVSASEEGRRSETDQAIAAYEKLLQAHRDHDQAVARLIVLYGQTLRLREQEDLRVQQAALRPTAFLPNALAARILLRRDEVALARQFNTRADAVLTSGTLQVHPGSIQSASVRTFHIAAAWHVSGATETLTLVDAAAAGIADVPAEEHIQYRMTLVAFYLGLGRLQQAEEQALQIPPSNARHNHLAWVFLEGGDIDRLRTHMREPYREPRTAPDPQRIGYLIRAGMVNEAEAELLQIRKDWGPHALAQIRLGQRRPDEAIALYEGLIASSKTVLGGVEGSPEAYLGLAAAWEMKGNLDRAIDVLISRFARRSESTVSSDSGRFQGVSWITARARLARLFRQVGRDAHPIEQDLRALLSQADPDHPVLVQLKAAR